MSDLSIVIPTLGRRSVYFSACLDSIFELINTALQVGLTTELIIVCPESRHGFVRCLLAGRRATLFSDPGSGPAGAINVGLRAASSPLVMWIGDDDVLRPTGVLNSVLSLKSQENAVFTFGNCWLIGETGEPLSLARPGFWALPMLRFGPDRIPQPGSVLRRSALATAGFLDEALGYAFDLDLFLRLLSLGGGIRQREVVAHFRIHPGSLTVSNPAPQAEAQVVRRKYSSPLEQRFQFLTWPVAKFAVRLVDRYQWRISPKHRFDGRLTPIGPSKDEA